MKAPYLARVATLVGLSSVMLSASAKVQPFEYHRVNSPLDRDFPASMCVPAKYADTNLVVGTGYVRNDGTGFEAVVCPVPRSTLRTQEFVGGLVDPYTFRIYMKVGFYAEAIFNTQHRIRCDWRSFRSIPRNGYLVKYESARLEVGGPEAAILRFDVQRNAYAKEHHVRCVLPPNGMIWGYSLRYGDLPRDHDYEIVE